MEQAHAQNQTYSAFADHNQIAAGSLEEVLPVLKARFDSGPEALVLVFDDRTGAQIDFALEGTLEDVKARAIRPVAAAGPGRPKLGVVAREVTLLPRHWAWLEEQPGGASAALRRLVEEACKRDPDQQRARQARDAANRFLTAMAGDLPGYEEATRCLYAGNQNGFESQIAEWPADVRAAATRFARDSFQSVAHGG